MVNTLKLPVGIDSFEKIRRNGFADAKRMLGTILANEMDRHYYLKTSDALTVSYTHLCMAAEHAGCTARRSDQPVYSK